MPRKHLKNYMTENNKKGDLMDGMLYFGKNPDDPIQLMDYPETVVQTLRLFYKIWNIPSYTIPSKKSKSKFDDWVLQLTELNSVCPSSAKMERAMKIAKETYQDLSKKFPVFRPLAIRNLIADSVRRMNDEEEQDKKKKQSENNFISLEVENKVSGEEAARKLKSLLEDD